VARRRAQVQFSQAGYEATVASYRGTVLSAFQEVQDNITGLEVLHNAQESQAQAVDASRPANCTLQPRAMWAAW